MNAKPITSMLLAAFGAALLATCVGAASGATTSRATARVAPLTTIRTDVNHWLAHAGFKGFTVGEVMAFSNNDYAAVNDKTGKPAFELLLSPTGSWVMEEPVSMMWNTTYGMVHSPRSFASRSATHRPRRWP